MRTPICQMIIFPFHSYYGDGSEIEPAVLQHIYTAMWSCAMGFRWRKSVVAVIDNLQVLHGRMGWTGERTLVTTFVTGKHVSYEMLIMYQFALRMKTSL